ncbi:CBS domain-containing protein [Taklimakanibacter albus]|uniref:CBS domain-containing protein n=1 Tax=Taklimakanibacter albus TaxID=2800327 RepID=A0ACC5R3P6_9HYPH|nr:CBS domain-containing protein [Aestuariivirga sp. YIM B02566]MBK1867228.1 CBS domain-containing protein [Aestuariivirga sp. YIM B02566]
MKIRECMSTDVRIARPDDTLETVALAMAEIDAGVMPVSEDDRLVGMITDRDIAVRGVAHGLGPEDLVGDVMSTEVMYCFEDEAVEQVLNNMGDIQIRRLPVLNRDKRLVGIVSLGDLAKTDVRAKTGTTLGDISRKGGLHSQTTDGIGLALD